LREKKIKGQADGIAVTPGIKVAVNGFFFEEGG